MVKTNISSPSSNIWDIVDVVVFVFVFVVVVVEVLIIVVVDADVVIVVDPKNLPLKFDESQVSLDKLLLLSFQETYI